MRETVIAWDDPAKWRNVTLADCQKCKTRHVLRNGLCWTCEHKKTPNRYDLDRACSMHNRLTSPSALRSDFEHSRCRRAARRVRRFINRYYREWDSGNLYSI